MSQFDWKTFAVELQTLHALQFSPEADRTTNIVIWPFNWQEEPLTHIVHSKLTWLTAKRGRAITVQTRFSTKDRRPPIDDA